MGRHHGYRDRRPGRHDDDRQGWSRDGSWDGRGRDPAGRPPLRLPWAVVFALLLVWSLLAWGTYALSDPVLGWVAAAAGVAMDSGRALATDIGGAEVGGLVGKINAGGLFRQALALLALVLKPVIILLWALGALVILAAPAILPRVGRLLARRGRH